MPIALCYDHVSLSTLQHFCQGRPLCWTFGRLIKVWAIGARVRAERCADGQMNQVITVIGAVVVKADHEHFTNVSRTIGELVQLFQHVEYVVPPSSKRAFARFTMANLKLKLTERIERLSNVWDRAAETRPKTASMLVYSTWRTKKWKSKNDVNLKARVRPICIFVVIIFFGISKRQLKVKESTRERLLWKEAF